MEVKLIRYCISFLLCALLFHNNNVYGMRLSDSVKRAYGLLPPKPVPSQPIQPTGSLSTPPKSIDQPVSKVEEPREQQHSTDDVLLPSSEMSSGSSLVPSLPSTSSSTVSTVVSSSSMHLPSAIVRSSTPAPSPLRKSYTIPELSPPSPHTPISTLNLSETKFEDAATTLTAGSTSSRRSSEGSPETSGGVPLVVDNNTSVSMTNSPLTSSSLLAPQSPLDRSPLPSTSHEFSESPISTQSLPNLSTMSVTPHVSPVVTQKPLTPHEEITMPISVFATTDFSAENPQITMNTSTFATLSSSIDEESEQNKQKQLISPLLSSSQDVRLLSSSPQVSPQISGTPPSRIYSSTSSPQSNTEDIPFAGTIADVTSAMDSLQLSLLRSHKKVDDHSDTTSHIEASRIEESQADTLKKEKEKKEEEENTEEDFSDSKDILPDTSSTDLRSTKSSDEKEVEKDSPQSPPTYSSSSSYKTPTRSSLMVPHTNTVGFGTTTGFDDERTQAGLVLAQSLLEEKENLGLGFQNITSFARENAGGSRVISTPRGTQYMISVNKLERNPHDEERRLLEKEKEEESEYDSESDDGCCCGCCCC